MVILCALIRLQEPIEPQLHATPRASGGCGVLLKYLGATEIPIKRRLSSRQSLAPNDPTGTLAPQLQQDRQESFAGN